MAPDDNADSSTDALADRPLRDRLWSVLIRRQRELCFSGVGIVVMVVGYGQLAFFIEGLHINPSLAYLMQAVISIELNFALNRHLTWRDRLNEHGFWITWWRFHMSRAATVPANQVAFSLLMLLGAHYLLANTVCIIASTVVNYLTGDKFVFRPGRDRVGDHTLAAATTPAGQTIASTAVSAGETPAVSVIVPVKNSQSTIRPLVDSLLNQDYPGTIEIVLVGDVNDATWTAVAGEIAAGQVVAIEAEVDTPARDANAKRCVGLTHASGEVLALTDSDMVLPAHWISTGVGLLAEGQHAVAGPMISLGSGFWGRYVDQNALGAKTPRIQTRYLLTADTFGKSGFKPPVTANFFSTREVIDAVGGPDADFARSYEDYPWFLRMVRAGYQILCDNRLAGYHLHRAGLASLGDEYSRAGWGCADYIVVYPTCRFARRRLRHLAATLMTGLGGLASLLLAPAWTILAALLAVVAAGVVSWWKVRSAASLLFPVCTGLLGSLFALGMLVRFARLGRQRPRPVITRHVALVPPPAHHGTGSCNALGVES